MYSLTIKHRDLFILKTCNHSNLKERKTVVLDQLVVQFELNGRDDLIIALKEKLITSFFNNFQKRFDKLSKNRKNYDFFESEYSRWLDNNFKFNFIKNAHNEVVKPGKNLHFIPFMPRNYFRYSVRKMRFYTFCKFLKSLLRPLYRKISFDTHAKDDSTLSHLYQNILSLNM